jgi:nucleotide-binding universal stress UspA family protein
MKILCAIDGSRYSQWALDWLRRLCAPDGYSLLLVHAVDMTQFKTLPKLDQKSRSALVKVMEFSFEGAAGKPRRYYFKLYAFASECTQSSSRYDSATHPDAL